MLNPQEECTKGERLRFWSEGLFVIQTVWLVGVWHQQLQAGSKKCSLGSYMEAMNQDLYLTCFMGESSVH